MYTYIHIYYSIKTGNAFHYDIIVQVIIVGINIPARKNDRHLTCQPFHCRLSTTWVLGLQPTAVKTLITIPLKRLLEC